MDAPVAVLIATYHRAARLGETLDVLARSESAPGLPWEAIVVDNDSTDDDVRVDPVRRLCGRAGLTARNCWSARCQV